jgi:hypothetical protein
MLQDSPAESGEYIFVSTNLIRNVPSPINKTLQAYIMSLIGGNISRSVGSDGPELRITPQQSGRYNMVLTLENVSPNVAELVIVRGTEETLVMRITLEGLEIRNITIPTIDILGGENFFIRVTFGTIVLVDVIMGPIGNEVMTLEVSLQQITTQNYLMYETQNIITGLNYPAIGLYVFEVVYIGSAFVLFSGVPTYPLIVEIDLFLEDFNAGKPPNKLRTFSLIGNVGQSNNMSGGTYPIPFVSHRFEIFKTQESGRHVIRFPFVVGRLRVEGGVINLFYLALAANFNVINRELTRINLRFLEPAGPI